MRLPMPEPGRPDPDRALLTAERAETAEGEYVSFCFSANFALSAVLG